MGFTCIGDKIVLYLFIAEDGKINYFLCARIAKPARQQWSHVLPPLMAWVCFTVVQISELIWLSYEKRLLKAGTELSFTGIYILHKGGAVLIKYLLNF